MSAGVSIKLRLVPFRSFRRTTGRDKLRRTDDGNVVSDMGKFLGQSFTEPGQTTSKLVEKSKLI